MTRRDLLKSTGAAAALVLAGCGGRPLAAPRTGHSATPQPLAIAGFSPPDSVRAAVVGEFKRVAPGIPLEFPETVANQYALNAFLGQLLCLWSFALLSFRRVVSRIAVWPSASTGEEVGEDLGDFRQLGLGG